jgi:hypothetical protein
VVEHTEIIVAGISLVGILAGAYVSNRKIALARAQEERATREAELAHKEMQFQSHALSFSAFLTDWDSTHQEIVNLLEQTEIDRVLIFRAWNGSLDPRWTTAVYQARQEGQMPMQYVHVGLDQDYVERLRRTVNDGILVFTVADIDDSLIRSVYENEGVKSSCWAFINSQKIQGTESVSLSYVSFSSHTHDVLESTTVTRCQLLTGRLKGLAANFDKDQG